MSVLFMESFDLDVETAGITRRGWTLVGGSPAWNGSGRTGACAVVGATEAMYRTIPNTQRVLINWAFYNKDPWNGSQLLLQLGDGATVHLQVRHNVDHTLSVLDGAGSVLGTSIQTLSTSVYAYIQVDATIDNAVGAVYLDVDNRRYLTITGVDTQNGASAYVSRVTFGGSSVFKNNIDDIIIADTLGSVNDSLTSFRKAKIEAHFPTGNGNSSQWMGSDGNQVDNYALVDETIPNDETDYVAGSEVGGKDTYGVEDMLVSSVPVIAVQVTHRARKIDSPAWEIYPIVRSGGADYQGTQHTLTISYADYFRVWDKDPATDAAWTISGVNAAEIGQEVV